MGFLDKVKDLVSKNADKVDTAIDKAGDVVDKKTQGKYAQHGRQGAGRREEGGRRHQQPPQAERSSRRQHRSGPASAARRARGAADLLAMAKLSVSVDVPLPPEKAWEARPTCPATRSG